MSSALVHAPPERRPRVPPALTRGGETLALAPILEELPGELGVVLWRSARNVWLWGATPPARRAGLFDPRAGERREEAVAALGVEAELLAPLSVVVRLLEAPERMDEARVVNACRRVALWAEQRGYLATALEFAQAAALTAPRAAPLAYAVGRLARRRAEYDRAESWYARAIVQARRGGDWRTYALAYSSIGNLNLRKGNFPLARRALERSLRTALRHSLHDRKGNAYHDLFAVALESGQLEESDELAARALHAYGARHPNLPRLAFDVAFKWIEEGAHRSALEVARVLPPHFAGACDRALATSLVARAAGGAGDTRAFEESWERLEEMLAGGCVADAGARVLLGLAHGAASLGRWEDAEAFAQRAHAWARERREARLQLEAERLVETIRSRTAAPPVVAGAAPLTLADGFVAALSQRAPAALAS